MCLIYVPGSGEFGESVQPSPSSVSAIHTHTHTHTHTLHKPDRYIRLFLNKIIYYGKDKWHATKVLAELNFRNEKEEL